MYAIKQYSLQRNSPSNKWLQRVFKTGFVFFLIKGLVWTAVAIWLAY